MYTRLTLLATWKQYVCGPHAALVGPSLLEIIKQKVMEETCNERRQF